ncbi:hypothetical protein BJX63DRAFT_421929 [Aspergillus granulosus]|uniref:LysM domain-containing protein n=1 Tax=Aspergillus granulosus TaxID=176169 RepID=A0ABR4H9P9_9EURO
MPTPGSSSSSDQCGTIASQYGISLSQFASYNPQVGADCSGLWLGYYVCVSLLGDTPSPTTATTTTTSNGITTPTPTRPGMVGNCDAFYMVQSRDTCAEIVQRYGVSLAQLSRWNAQVGTDCSGLWAGYYICVSVVGPRLFSAVESGR